MDKKTEIARAKGLEFPQTAAPAAIPAAPTTAAEAVPPSATTAPTPTGWWMYHGDPAHTGYVSDSSLNSSNVKSNSGSASAPSFTTLFSLSLDGPVLSVPAVTGGYVYVGLANSQVAQGGNGGALHKIDIQTGNIVNTFNWDLGDDAPDAHSFAGMGSTPAVVNGYVYFGAFNGKFYCLDQQTLKLVWVTDLRKADPPHNQPITNIAGVAAGAPPPVVWSSPVVSADGTNLYVGCGEGENDQLFSFVFCLDTANGNVNWIYCTNQYVDQQPNLPNVLPAGAVGISPLPPPYTTSAVGPIIMGCSVWGAITYDSNLNRLYCSTGNQAPEPNAPPELPSPGYSNGILSLDAGTGEFKAFFQVPAASNYRESDFDIDVGGSSVIFKLNAGQPNEQTALGFGCKNGSFFVLDADTLVLLKRQQLLPYMNDGTWVATVDKHPIDQNAINPDVSNDESNATQGENFSGVFNTPAHYPGSSDNPQTISPRFFIGMGGPNYHNASPGIDFNSTPFMRAIDAATLANAWPMDNNDPPHYRKTSFMDPNINTEVGMYTTAGECGLSSPAVVNDVVFCTTSKIAIYAFDVRDGSFLWYDDLGMQTDGYNGGYGYCLGPAIWKDYVVAGALVFGREGGGILRIYGLSPQPTT